MARSQPAQPHSLPVAGMLAGLSAAGTGVMVVFTAIMVVWVLAAHGDDNTAAVVRACGSVWLGLHLVPLTVGGNPLGLLPWLFTAVPAWSVWRATRWALDSARPMQRYEYALLLGYLTLTYVTIALPISMFSSTPDLYTSDGLSVLRTMALVTPVSLACMWRHGNLKLVIPTLVQRGCRAGLTAAMLLYLQGAALVAASLIVHRAQVQSVTALMAPDALDGLFLTLLGIGYLPTAATWGMAYLIGPGVALGAGAVVSPTAATPGRLPAFPLLAMLPSDAIPAGFLLALGPIAAGAAMYAKSPRLPWRATQSGPLLRAPELAGALIAIGVCGVVVAALCLASSGAVGRDLLADVGPHASLVTTWAVGLSGGTCLALLVLPRVALMVLARSAAAQRT